MTTGHPHAALMAEYAEVAKTSDEPWLEFEHRLEGETWEQFRDHPFWDVNASYRRKPAPKKTVRVYQWILFGPRSGYFVSNSLFTEADSPASGVKRIEPGFEIEVEE